jgi:hypothetical protein
LPVELVLVERLPALSARENEALALVIIDLHGEPARWASRYPGCLVADGKGTIPTPWAIARSTSTGQRHPLGLHLAADHALLLLLLHLHGGGIRHLVRFAHFRSPE